MTYVWLVVGFVLLIKGADWFVDSASTIAKKLSISPIIIGLTIIAFGTSAPEAVVSIIAALEGNGDMVAGNVVGSNIINITLVLGLTVVVAPIVVEKEVANRDIIFALGASVLMLLLISERWFGAEGGSVISRLDGVIILGGLLFYMFYIFKKAKRAKSITMDDAAKADSTEEGQKFGWARLIVVLIIGLVGIVLGGELVVSSATEIAVALGMSQALVGLTIIALGTSLPELVTSVMAAFKGETEMAMGNLIGSNIFNILLVTGLASSIMPLDVTGVIVFDIILMILITVMLFIFARTGYRLRRTEGIVLVAIYLVYFVYIILRG
ncbi:calcium/sodium antiporter [Lacicoccus qingdaonensis]|uniref:Cation:H+ antiporter n=1 Tax=Lacicoccus qingdaonensis TaxID=576118 RepID=A0A1G9HM69_9BACL|nr:calcium/sodium antiporter [Salinicoccus qingdaonensis]SDL14068.1 cation:H+ antiporter [Salinicoccus qingdaonensis]